MPQLSVNIDHVATIRQARRTIEPDPVQAAAEAEAGGADGITVHLREDRRHIQDHDVERLKEALATRLNLEMAATEEMVAIACRIRPGMAMLVPEGRMEITTEGGLDVAGQKQRLRDVVAQLRETSMRVSAFVDAEPHQIEAAAEVGFGICEVHTGPYAHAFQDHGGDLNHPAVVAEVEKVAEAGRAIQAAGMAFNAGHGLTALNVGAVAALEGLEELHIGHSIVSRAVFVGLREAVGEMKRAMQKAQSKV